MLNLRVVLAIVFGWSTLKTVESLVRPGAMDRWVFEAAGVPWLFWVFLLPLVVFQIGALAFLVQPQSARAYRLAQLSVFTEIAESACFVLLTFGKPDLLQQAILASRGGRGLEVRLEVLQATASTTMQIAPLLISAAFGLLWLVLLGRVRITATRPDGEPVPGPPPDMDID